MTSINYNLNTPAGPDNPSNDRPLLTENTNAVNEIWGQDHVPFTTSLASSNFCGYHKQAHILVQATIPSGNVPGIGTMYTKTTATSASTNESTLYYTPDQSGNEYQITRTISTHGATFGTNNAYGSPGAGYTQIGGWTFLPGGLLMQYGFFSGVAVLLPNIQFPVAYTTGPFSVNLTPGGSLQGVNYVFSAGTTGFTLGYTSVTGTINIYWQAIGK